MNKRRPSSDDVLFISALIAILLGVAFLLYTTGAFVGAPRVWPLLMMAAGGSFLYLALVRGASFSFFFIGILIALEGVFFLAAMLLSWKIAKAWPLCMSVAGLAGLVSGLAAKKRFRAFFAVPSLGFAALGLFFAVFSFGIAGVSFKGFIAVWWPSLLIAGGISLFVAYGLSRRASPRGAGRREGGERTLAGKTPDLGDRDRGPKPGP
jgi:hypothetical protein